MASPGRAASGAWAPRLPYPAPWSHVRGPWYPGRLPAVGQLAALDRSYFLGDPGTALGIPVRDIVVQGPLGPLPAWYFPGPARTFIVAVHGQNGTRKDVLRVIDIVHRMGFPALAVTYRNDLGVPRDPSGYLRYGQTEWSDIEAAVRWSLAQGARSVVLVGQSMGGGVVAAFLERSSLAPKVARVVLDAPMLDLHAAIDYQADRNLLPDHRASPGPVDTEAEGSPARASASTGPLPVTSMRRLGSRSRRCITHGDDDLRVPISISIRLKRAEALPRYVRAVPGRRPSGVMEHRPVPLHIIGGVVSGATGVVTAVRSLWRSVR